MFVPPKGTYKPNEYIKKEDYYIIVIHKKDETYHAKIDIDDYDLVSKRRWTITKQGYCVSCSQPRILLHRFIMNNPTGKQIDHANGDKIDNRRCNLRICDNRFNSANKEAQKNNSLGIKNISFDSKKELYVFRLVYRGKLYTKRSKNLQLLIEYRNKLYKDLNLPTERIDNFD